MPRAEQSRAEGQAFGDRWMLKGFKWVCTAWSKRKDGDGAWVGTVQKVANKWGSRGDVLGAQRQGNPEPTGVHVEHGDAVWHSWMVTWYCLQEPEDSRNVQSWNECVVTYLKEISRDLRQRTCASCCPVLSCVLLNIVRVCQESGTLGAYFW